MLAGELYRSDDPELVEAHRRAVELVGRYNRTTADEPETRRGILTELLGALGPGSELRPPSPVITAPTSPSGPAPSSTSGWWRLDAAAITIGDDVQIGPNVQLLAPTHPLDAGLRRDRWEAAGPISIGDNVWLGGGVIVLGDVTIGSDTVVGAGAVVTRDLPPGVLAVGTPARIIRRLGEPCWGSVRLTRAGPTAIEGTAAPGAAPGCTGARPTAIHRRPYTAAMYYGHESWIALVVFGGMFALRYLTSQRRRGGRARGRPGPQTRSSAPGDPVRTADHRADHPLDHRRHRPRARPTGPPAWPPVRFRDPFVRHEQRYWSGRELDRPRPRRRCTGHGPPAVGARWARGRLSPSSKGTRVKAPLGRQLPVGQPETWSTAGGMVAGHVVPGPVFPAAKAVQPPPPASFEHVVRTLVLGRHLGPGRIGGIKGRRGHQSGTGPVRAGRPVEGVVGEAGRVPAELGRRDVVSALAAATSSVRTWFETGTLAAWADPAVLDVDGLDVPEPLEPEVVLAAVVDVVVVFDPLDEPEQAARASAPEAATTPATSVRFRRVHR